MRQLQVAIDGPAGAGKSTVARLVAERLHLVYIDTGAMYRAITLAAMEEGISTSDRAGLTKLTDSLSLKLEERDGRQIVFVNGRDVTEQLRTPEVSAKVSMIAQVPGVRERLVALQKTMAMTAGVVMDGRDIGTSVLPHAEVKIFLTASLKERALRRMKEMSALGYNVALEDVEQDLAKRDQLDQQREHAPLRKAVDAHEIDTSGLTATEVASEIVNICQRYVNSGGVGVDGQ